MNIERNCINICSISGNKKDIEHIDDLLNKDFSMDTLLPIFETKNTDTNIERLMNWGCEEDMELLTYISCGFFDPQTIDMTYSTDIPNTLFLRRLSYTYDLTIEHAYNDYKAGYVGFNKIVNGEIVDLDYEEDSESEKYKQLQKELDFYSDEEIREMELEEINQSKDYKDNKEQTIIQIQDLLKLKRN